MNDVVEVTGLGKTWLFDLDGTVLVHNGYKNGGDVLIDGVKKFFDSIPDTDKIIFLTSRRIEYKIITENFLKQNGIRFDNIIYDLPYGERILINDRKNSGLAMAIAINTTRNQFMDTEFKVNDDL